MGAPSSDAEVLKQYVEAFERKDWEAATAFWADDVVLHVQGRNPLAGDFVGKRTFLEHYGRLFAELGGTMELVEVREVLLGAKYAVALVKERAVRGQRSLDFDRVNVYHLRGGKIAEIWSYDSDPYVLDEFGPKGETRQSQNARRGVYSPKCLKEAFSEVRTPPVQTP